MQLVSSSSSLCSSSALTFAAYGTVMYIDSADTTQDGRSLVKTTGERRFQVVSKGMTDGYNTATIEFIKDTEVTEEEDIGEWHMLYCS